MKNDFNAMFDGLRVAAPVTRLIACQPIPLAARLR
jgi:hypothetical protein